MFSRRCWTQVRAINGGSFLLKSILNLSTTTTHKALTQNADTVDFLVNSLDFSKDAAVATLSKVPSSRPFQKTPIQELGLSGTDLIEVLMAHKSIWSLGLDNQIKSRVLYLRELVGSDDNVVKVIKRYPLVLGRLDTEMLENNFKLLRNYGFTLQCVAGWITKKPRIFFVMKPEEMEEILSRVENDLGIPRGSNMFRYGFEVVSSFTRSNIDEKLRVFRSLGWSESEMFRMVRTHPFILTRSSLSIQKAADYFRNEVGYSLDYMASHPVLFTISLEKRVKPRNEVLRILNEKKLNKLNTVLYTVLIKPESKFLKYYILPYTDILPDLYETYMRKAEMPKIKL
ncbi:OLC1v1005700C1 [Oldenlandia corymbosa var. corymbosa]|uniref:OLC1v1005700C1 n=1 Tax=Oldenlandia corymbosa var. corymbosa TaxID=529605 RepID=A0AAV1DFH1_OLDCO|nr:OLC1v1005700C1 [Oldenlandia corymbosa var. corymbosa]